MKIIYKSTVIIGCLITFILVNLIGSTTKNYTVKNNHVTIAMAQIVCIDGDLSGNLVRIENAIVEAKEKHAEIIVFPESCLLGWINPEAHKRAYPIPLEMMFGLPGRNSEPSG